MTPITPGGVVIYDVVNETFEEEASTGDFTFVTQYSTCVMSEKGKIATVVQDEHKNKLILTYARKDK